MLGLTGRGTEEWARLRGYQYAQLALVSRARLLAQALAALVVVTRFAPFVGYGVMAGWAPCAVRSAIARWASGRWASPTGAA